MKCCLIERQIKYQYVSNRNEIERLANEWKEWRNVTATKFDSSEVGRRCFLPVDHFRHIGHREHNPMVLCPRSITWPEMTFGWRTRAQQTLNIENIHPAANMHV